MTFPGRKTEVVALANAQKLSNKEAGWNQYYNQYRQNAKARGQCFELPKEQFKALASSPCTYCGELPHKNETYYKGRLAFITKQGTVPRAIEHYIIWTNGIDRVDSTQGYYEANCVPCCFTCNRAKCDMTMDTWRDWIQKLTQHSLS